jgi:hypothetical protein
MGSAKRYIEDHIENCREHLTKEFVVANIADFLEWAEKQDITDIWDLMNTYCEDIFPDEFWEFCADDLNE